MMTSPRNDMLPWTSRLPFTIMTPQPSTLPLFVICALPPLPNWVTVQTGGLAYGLPKLQLQLLLTCVQPHCVTVMSATIWLICATVGPDGDVEMLGTGGLP